MYRVINSTLPRYLVNKKKLFTRRVFLTPQVKKSTMQSWLFSLEPWARRENCLCAETSRFHSWMLQRSDMMKTCMIASVRTRAGLGIPPEKFYTNDSENTNRQIRHKTGGKELGETEYAKAMKELIEDDQETEFILALFDGSEQYEFRESFRHLPVSNDVWFGMTEERRKKDSYRLCSIHGGFVRSARYSVSRSYVFCTMQQYNGKPG